MEKATSILTTTGYNIFYKKRYLVFAYRSDNGHYAIHNCSLTGLVKNREEVINILRQNHASETN